MINVLLVEDQEMVRAGFALILNSEPDIRVVAEAGDGVEAIELYARHQVDVCVVDIRMPRIDGLELVRRWAGPQASRRARIVVVTTFDDPDVTNAALRSGATGLLLKDAGPALLVEAIRSAHRGDCLLAPSVASRMLRDLQRSKPSAPPPRDPLTDRERAVLQHVAQGQSNKEIAGRLHLSVSTVKLHLASLQVKIGASNRTELAAWAYQAGEV